MQNWKVKVSELGTQTQNFGCIETYFTGQTDSIVVRYSENNSVVLSND
jgi:hypothetical protein